MSVTTARDSEGSQARVLVALSLGTFTIIGTQLLLPPLLPAIVAEFGISRTGAGMALTVMWACASLAMYPGGQYSDHLSRRTVLVGAVLVLISGSILATAAPIFGVFVLGLAIIGTGIGLYEPASFASVFDLFSAKRGTAYGVISSAYNVGSVLGVGFATLALSVAAWRLGLVAVVVLGLFAAGALYRWIPGPLVVSRIGLHPRAAISRSSTRRLTVLLALFCLYMFIWQGSLSFFPTLLRDELGTSSNFANAAFGCIFLTGLVVSPVAGALGDRFEKLRVVLLTPLLGTGGLALVLSDAGSGVVFVGSIAFGVGLVSFWPVMTDVLMAHLTPETIGADYGILRAVFYGVGSLAPTYVGAVADRLSLSVSYWTLAVGFLLAIPLLLWLHRADAD